MQKFIIIFQSPVDAFYTLPLVKRKQKLSGGLASENESRLSTRHVSFLHS